MVLYLSYKYFFVFSFKRIFTQRTKNNPLDFPPEQPVKFLSFASIDIVSCVVDKNLENREGKMMLKRISRKIDITLLLILIVLILPINTAIGAPKQMSMAVGTLGGSLGRMGAGVSEVFNRENKAVKISVVPGGGAANPERVGMGGTEFGVTFSNFAQLAYRGKKPFKKSFPNLRGVIAFYKSFYHQYVAKELYDKGIRTWDDIINSKKPFRMGVIRKGTSSDFVNRSIVSLYGLSYDDLTKRGFTLTFTGTGQTAKAYQNKQIDMWFNNTGPPNGAGMQACIARPTVFMNLPKHLVTKMKEKGFSESTLPAGMYKGQNEDKYSIGAAICILTTEKMDPQIVYDLLSITHSNKKFLSGVHKSFKKLDSKKSWDGIGIPLHEGAKRYYREQGINID